MAVERIAVLGAGVMGAAIAAHCANAGFPVLLLDIVPEGAADRSAIARGAIEKLLKTNPAALMSSRLARLITPGNLEDDLPKLAEIDWIIEAVVENPKIKAALYTKIEAVRKAGSIVSSNTSTIPLQYLVQGQSEAFRRDFLITHFFNPVRYMRLLELVPGPDTRPEAIEEISSICDIRLGKGVVRAKDSPGFIANRIGTLWIQAGINAALDQGLTVEEADILAGKPIGVPKTGIFGFTDLVGIDLMPHLAASLLKILPPEDLYCSIYREIPLIGRMIERGLTGRKGLGGFYRLIREGEAKRMEVIDLATGEYRAEQKPDLAAMEVSKKGGLKALAALPDKYGQYVWAMLRDTLSYAASLVPAIAGDIAAVDEAMRLGYNWKYGPFELLDQLGTAWFAERLQAEGREVPALLAQAAGRPFYRVANGQAEYLAVDGEYMKLQRPEGVLLLADIKRAGSKPLVKNRLGLALGYRRWRRLPRIHQQDEHVRPADHGNDRQGAGAGRGRQGPMEGAGRL